MILHKEIIKEKNIISKFISENQFQPAGVDLTLKEVIRFIGKGQIDFDNKERVLSDCKPIPFENEWVSLEKGIYKIIYNEIIRIPIDCVGIALPRSSLLRCGAFVSCALWDPGYEGRSESLLFVGNENGIKLKRNARVVQIFFLNLIEKAKEIYSGIYKGENI